MTGCLRDARAVVREADALLITAGAGMGVDSGLPDFRGRDGFWRAYPAIAGRGLRFEEMACPDWFTRDPHLAWAFYGHRLQLYRATRPHAGFQRLLECARGKARGYAVFTSNVDGHFQQAGFDSQQIHECHGSIHHLQCSVPCSDRIWSAKDTGVEVDPVAFRATDPLPRCPACGAVARPNILMFGDYGWLGGRTEQQAQRFDAWLDGLGVGQTRLAIVEIGAGTGVPTVRLTSEQIAAAFDARLIRINPRDAALPPGPHLRLRMGALEALQGLLGA